MSNQTDLVKDNRRRWLFMHPAHETIGVCARVVIEFGDPGTRTDQHDDDWQGRDGSDSGLGPEEA